MQHNRLAHPSFITEARSATLSPKIQTPWHIRNLYPKPYDTTARLTLFGLVEKVCLTYFLSAYWISSATACNANGYIIFIRLFYANRIAIHIEVTSNQFPKTASFRQSTIY
jgi:hypothetical protein